MAAAKATQAGVDSPLDREFKVGVREETTVRARRDNATIVYYDLHYRMSVW